MLARFVALIAAVAMVAGALAYRNSRDGGGDNGQPDARAIVCAEEVGAACAAFPGSLIEPAAKTATRLIEARSVEATGFAGWLAPGAWPEMVDDARAAQNREKLFSESRTLAHTDLVAVVRQPKVMVPCAARVTWKCLGEAAQEPGFLLGADRAESSSGLFLRAALLGGFFGRTDFASNDLEESQGWMDNIERRVEDATERNARDVHRFVVAAPDVAAFLTTAVELKGVSIRSPLEVVRPQPRASVTAVFVTRLGTEPDVDLDEAGRRLVAGGWTAGAGPRDDGLPSPGVLLALREEI